MEGRKGRKGQVVMPHGLVCVVCLERDCFYYLFLCVCFELQASYPIPLVVNDMTLYVHVHITHAN